MKTVGYRETLELARQNNISLAALNAASSAEACFTFEYTPEQFESLAGLVEYGWLKDCSGEITTDNIANAINWLITHDEELSDEPRKTIDEVLAMDKWDLLDAAVYHGN